MSDPGDEHQPPRPGLVASDGVIRPIVPRTVDEAFRLATGIVKAGLAPDSYEKDPQKIMLGILAGLELGVPPLTALRNIMIVNNRYCVWGDLAIALVQSNGLLAKQEAWYEIDGQVIPNGDPAFATFPDGLTCVVRLFRKEQERDPYEGRFSIADAKRAHLYPNPRKQPWMLYTARMLFNRARAFPIRDGFADALAGLSIREEIEDLPAPPPAPTDTSFLGPVTDKPMDTTPSGIGEAAAPDPLPRAEE